MVVQSAIILLKNWWALHVILSLSLPLSPLTSLSTLIILSLTEHSKEEATSAALAINPGVRIILNEKRSLVQQMDVVV